MRTRKSPKIAPARGVLSPPLGVLLAALVAAAAPVAVYGQGTPSKLTGAKNAAKNAANSSAASTGGAAPAATTTGGTAGSPAVATSPTKGATGSAPTNNPARQPRRIIMKFRGSKACNRPSPK